MRRTHAALFLFLLTLLAAYLPAAAAQAEAPSRNALHGEDIRASELAERDPAETGSGSTPAADAPADESRYREEIPADPAGQPLSRGTPGRGTVEAPDKYWASSGYPENVSYAYEAGGELLEDGTIRSWWEIGLLDTSEDCRNEILDLLSPTCLVTFYDCTYSYAQRYAAYEALTARSDSRIQNCLLALNTESVLVWTSPEERQALQEEVSVTYGALVVVLDTEAAVDDFSPAIPGSLPDMGSSAAPPAPGSAVHTDAAPPAPGAVPSASMPRFALLLACLAAAVLLPAAGWLLLRRRQPSPAACTAEGNTAAAASALTRADAAAAIRASSIRPPAHLYTDLLSRLSGTDEQRPN